MRLHRDVNRDSTCGGQVADGDLFGEDYWCVYCGAKWSGPVPAEATAATRRARDIDDVPWGS